MADINEILGKQINSVKELKAAIKELQDSLVGVDAESEQFKTTSEQLAAAQAELNKVTKAGKDDNDAATDSIRGMEQEYKKLYDTYKMLTEEQRNSDFGKGMAESLNKLSESINERKKEVGNFKDNIGRYSQSITDAFKSMGLSVGALEKPLALANGGVKTLGKSLKTLFANPYVAIISAIVVVIMKAAEAIKKNEELTQRLHQAMSVFKPVLDAVSNAFDFLAGILVKTIEGLSKVAEKIMSIIPGMKQAIQSHKELEKATQNLTKATREANIENSKKEAEIERLREEASETDNLVEKKKLLEEAKAKQAEIDQKNIELAQEELRILQEYSEKTANAAEDNEKLAAAQEKVNQAIAQGERNMRQYNKQIAQTEKSTKTATSAGKNYREEAKKLYEQLVEENKTEITKLTEKYEKEKKLLEKYHLDTKLLTKKYNEEIGKLYVSRTNSQLSAARETNNHIRRESDLMVELWNDEIAKTQNEIDVFVNGTTSRFNTLNDELNKAYNKYVTLFKSNSIFGGETTFNNSKMSKVIQLLQNDGNIQKATDFAAIIEKINAKIANFQELAEKKDSKNSQYFAQQAKYWEDILKTVNELGEAGWVDLTKGIEKAANKLADLDDLVGETGSEMQLMFEKRALDVKKLYDTLADLKIDKAVREATQNLFTGEFLDGLMTESLSSINEVVLQNEHEILDAQKTALEQQLLDFKGTNDKKLELMQEYYSVANELRNKDLAAEQLNAERSWSIYEAANDHFLQMHDSLDSILGSIQNVMQAELNSGKLTEKEAKKKRDALKALQAVQLAVAISNIAANTAAGIMDVWRGYSAELPMNAATAAATGPYTAPEVKAALDAKSLTSAIIRTATIGSQGTAQLAAAVGGYIANTKSASGEEGGGSAGVGVGATPTLIDSTPYSYTRTVQTTEEEDEMNRPIYVTVTDIEDGLKQKVTVTNESSF